MNHVSWGDFILACNTKVNYDFTEKKDLFEYPVYIEGRQENVHVIHRCLYTCMCIINSNFFVLVNDYEDQIQKKTQDMDQQVQLVSDLDSEVKRLQVSHTDWKINAQKFSTLKFLPIFSPLNTVSGWQ